MEVMIIALVFMLAGVDHVKTKEIKQQQEIIKELKGKK